MATVQEIEAAVSQFSHEQLADFDAWYADFKARAWDKQFEADAAAGRFNALAAEALSDYQAGRTRAL